MARYQVILAYDGTHFMGFQRQKSARTVQGVVEAAIRHLGWDGTAVLAAGRTDTGVHPSGQVIAFDLAWAHSPQTLLKGINARLPKDVAALVIQTVPDDFHPRYDAIQRRYRYRLFCQEIRSPLRERYAWRVWPGVAFERLQKAATLMGGTHDFAAFGSPLHPQGSTVRTVIEAVWSQDGEQFVFEIAANAFLYHMVRRLVNLQVRIGQGRMELQDLEEGLNHRAPQPPGLAPPQGLELVGVTYPELTGSMPGDQKFSRKRLALETNDED